MPLWWVLGLTPFLSILTVVGLGALLASARNVQLLPGSLPLLSLTAWILPCAVMLDSTLRLVGFGFRWALIAAAAVVFVYVGNSRVSDRALLGGLGVIGLLVLVGGYLGLLLPYGGFETPMARLIPGALWSSDVVHDLLLPRFAEVQQPWGASQPFLRPAAPFPYTNGWGCAVALLVPSMLALRQITRSSWVRAGIPVGLLACVAPAVATRNRGMLLVVGVVLAAQLAGLLRRGDGRRVAALTALVAAGVVGFLALGGWRLIEERQRYSDTTSGRASVYQETLAAVTTSPVLGFGAPRPSEEIGVSMGTQGAWWTLLFSYGFLGVALFLAFLARVLWTTHTTACAQQGTDGLWLHSALVGATVAGIFYGFDAIHLLLIVIPAAILVRRRRSTALVGARPRHAPHLRADADGSPRGVGGRGRLPEFEQFRALRRFSALDGLRAFAVAAVVWQHTARSDAAFGLAATGGYGVDLFFAISGFLITTLLLREYAARGRVDLKAFYVRRSLRIFPLYYAVLAVYVVLVVGTERETARGQEFWSHLPAFLTYTSNWFVRDNGVGTTFYFAWSLATEEQFYLAWAPVVALALLKARHGLAWAAGYMSALTVLDLAVTAAGGSSLMARIATSIATPICVAALLAIVVHTRRGFHLSRWIAHASAVAGLLAAVLALLVLRAPRPLVGAALAVLVVALCLRDRCFLSPVLTWRPVVWFGMVSYGVYLMHMLAANAAVRVLPVRHGPALFLATLAVVSGMAWLSWRGFESPILAYKRRWERKGAELAIAPSQGLRGGCGRQHAEGRVSHQERNRHPREQERQAEHAGVHGQVEPRSYGGGVGAPPR